MVINEDKLSIIAESVQIKELLDFVSPWWKHAELQDVI